MAGRGGSSRQPDVAAARSKSPRDVDSPEDCSEQSEVTDDDSDGRLCCCLGGEQRSHYWSALKADSDEELSEFTSSSQRTFQRPGAKPGFIGLASAMSSNVLLSCLLVFVPIGFLSHFLAWERALVFSANFLAILPMAWLIGKSTEDLAVPCGDVLGGLLNATFGNIVEMLLCIAGIRQNQLIVVQCTLVGSILSNLLLVLGTAFLWGGYWHDNQKFNKSGAACQSSLLLLAVLAICLPTVYGFLVPGNMAVLVVSRGISILMFLMYFQYLFFQLVTHQFLFEPEPEPKDEQDAAEAKEEEDEETPDMTPWTATIVLGICTVLTACCSEYLIASIEGTIKSWKVTSEFIGVILLPIIGNAAEHYSAIVVAGRKKMDLALNIAMGSACQMAILVTPFSVLTGWAVGTDMTLDFHPFQAGVLLLSVIVVANILKGGNAYWLEGSMLTAAFATIALIYYFDREDATYFERYSD